MRGPHGEPRGQGRRNNAIPAPERTRLARLSSIGERARPAAACIVLIRAQDRAQLGRRWVLGEGERLTIGRDAGSSIVIDAASVSRSHVRIESRKGGHVLLDLRSTNGTLLNDRVVSEERLRGGDRFKVGPAIFKYLAGGDLEAQYHEDVYSLIVTDTLTRASTRRFFLECLDREFARAQRHGRPLSLVMLDVDHFKRINDRYGHAAGDHVLRELCDTVRAQVRADECLARFGGEEFAVLLSEATGGAAAIVAEKLRAAVAGHRFVFEEAMIAVTISVGVAALEPGMTRQQLIRAADEKLYEAKRTGRNRVST